MSGSPPDDVRNWLQRAREGLANAELQPGGGFSDPCFLAQQAAERALKGLLVANGVTDFPYTHDIAELLDLLEEQRREMPNEVREAEFLTEYATARRYPPSGVTSRDEYEQVMAAARAVVEWVEAQLRDDA